MKHPIQPLEKDEHGTIRFKGNKIVQYLLDNGPFNMNDLAVQEFSQEDREQFAQLIGYSLSGFGELSYVSDETYYAAEKSKDSNFSSADARNEVLRDMLDDLKEGLRQPIARLFGIHPDDLK